MSETQAEAELRRRTGESLDELHYWRDLGLLPVGPDGELESTCADRVRLIQFARRRGIDVNRIAAAVADQPDLLTFFEEQIGERAGKERTLDEAAAEAGVAPALAAGHAGAGCPAAHPGLCGRPGPGGGGGEPALPSPRP